MPKEHGTPGPRAIYPSMVTSRSLSKCGVVANALWPRLVALADDQGRLHGDAADVLGECFPKMLDKVTYADVAEALEQLQRHRQVRPYEADEEPYIQLLNWWEYQGSQRRAYPSRHPAPEGWTDYVYGFAEHPNTLRDARGLPPYVRNEADEVGTNGDEVGTTPGGSPHNNGHLPTSGDDKSAHPPGAGQQLRTLPGQKSAPSPQRADFKADFAASRADARAQPRPRGAVPCRALSMPDRATRGGSVPPAKENGVYRPTDEEKRTDAVARARAKLTDPGTSDDVRAAARFALGQMGESVEEPEPQATAPPDEVDFGTAPAAPAAGHSTEPAP